MKWVAFVIVFLIVMVAIVLAYQSARQRADYALHPSYIPRLNQ